MADDKKNIPEVAPPTEAPAPAAENAAVPEQPAPEPVLTDAEAVMLGHEGQAALFEMGEAVPDPADAVTHAEVEEPAAPEVPKAEKEQAQPPDPGKDDPAPAHSGKVVDFAAARDEAAKEEKKAVKQMFNSQPQKVITCLSRSEFLCVICRHNSFRVQLSYLSSFIKCWREKSICFLFLFISAVFISISIQNIKIIGLPNKINVPQSVQNDFSANSKISG